MHLNRIIFYTIFETITLIITLGVTYHMWDNFKIDESAKIAYSYTNKNEKISIKVDNNFKELIPLNDNLAFNNKNNFIIELYNPSEIKKQYALYLKINDNTNLDLNYLKINKNSDKEFVRKLENYKKELNSYFLIKNGIIKSKETLYNEVYIWLTEETPNTEQNKILDFNFYLEEI